jgi:hypothetical protein
MQKKNANDRGLRTPVETDRIHKGNDTRDLDAVIDQTLRPKRRLSYFERETALALGKTLDSQGNIDLSESANQTSYRGTGRQNRNAMVDPVLGAQKSTTLHAGDYRDGDLGRHSRFCKGLSGTDIQGRNCNVCHGIGFYAFERLRAEKTAGNSANQPRHEMWSQVNRPEGAYAQEK